MVAVDGDRLQLNGAVPFHQPDRRLPILLEQRAARYRDARALVQCHAAGDIGAEPHLRRRARQRDAHRIGAGRRISLRGEIADPPLRPDIWIADQVDFDRRVFPGRVLEERLGDIEDCLALARLCQADHHLPGAENLPGIGAYCGNNPVIVGFQLGVAEILAGLDLSGARRIELRLRGLEGLEGQIVLHPRGVAVLEELALAIFLALAPRLLGLRGRDLGFGDLEILTVLLRVEPAEEVTLLDRRPDIDRPLEDLAADPEPDIGLVARLYLAGERDRLPSLAGFDGHRAHRPDIGRRGLFFLFAGRQNQHQNESTDRSRRKR